MRINDLLAIARKDCPDITEEQLKSALLNRYVSDLIAAQTGSGSTDIIDFVQERITESVAERLEKRIASRS